MKQRHCRQFAFSFLLPIFSLLFVLLASGCRSIPTITVSSERPILAHHSFGTVNSYGLRLGDVILIDPKTKRAEKFCSIPIPDSDIDSTTLPSVKEIYPMQLFCDGDRIQDEKEKQFLQDAISRSTFLVLNDVAKRSIADEWKYADRIIEPGIKRDDYVKDCRFLLVTTLYTAASVTIANEYSTGIIRGDMLGEDVQIGNEEFALMFRLPLDDLREYFHFRVFKLEDDAKGDIVFKPDTLNEVRLDEYKFIARP